jgi:hypothetical protein
MNATVTITPTASQHMRALERANRVRLARAELKRRVATGELDAAEVIGQTRCRKFLAQIPMSETKTVGSMTDRQRRTLAAMLSSTGPGRACSATPWLMDSLTTA